MAMAVAGFVPDRKRGRPSSLCPRTAHLDCSCGRNSPVHSKGEMASDKFGKLLVAAS